MKDRFLLHCSDRKNWRLRHSEHPCDPCWEEGSYSRCHPIIRPRIDVGSKVFDVVVTDRKAIIRSAFVVSKIRDESGSRIFFFDSFYFAEKKPIELPEHYIQYRQMRLEKWIKKYGQKSPWNRIAREYTEYRKGEKPVTIEKKLWDNMVNMCRKSRIHKMKTLKVC